MQAALLHQIRPQQFSLRQLAQQQGQGQGQQQPGQGGEQPAAAEGTEDYQLQRAFDLLRGLALYNQRNGN